MFGGTWVRIGWLLAKKVEDWSFMDKCGFALRSAASCLAVRLGAMEGEGECERGIEK